MDIAMCRNVDCELRMKCLRYTAIPSEYRQFYINFNPLEDGTCEHFMKNKGYKINPKLTKKNND